MSEQVSSDNKCKGSGQSPVEMVILDTVPGVDPKATCRVCLKSVYLRISRISEHERPT